MRHFIWLTGLVLIGCSEGPTVYEPIEGQDGQLYILNRVTGTVQRVEDDTLVLIPSARSPAREETLPTFSNDEWRDPRTEIIEDFEIAIRILDGVYNTAVGELDLLDCFREKDLPANLSLSRLRGEIINVLSVCTHELNWFNAVRPPFAEPTDTPKCGEEIPDAEGYSICWSESDGTCVGATYLGDGAFLCDQVP